MTRMLLLLDIDGILFHLYECKWIIDQCRWIDLINRMIIRAKAAEVAKGSCGRPNYFYNRYLYIFFDINNSNNSCRDGRGSKR